MSQHTAPNAQRRDFVFNQINGFYQAGTADGVTDESHAGGTIGTLIEAIYHARNRLCARKDIDPDKDRDLDEMISKYEELCYQCGILMYHYGWYDASHSD